MDYSLNFLGSTRKASNVTFYSGKKYYLRIKLKSTLRKVIVMLLMTVSLICSVLLLLSTNHVNKKHELVNAVKHHSTG